MADKAKRGKIPRQVPNFLLDELLGDLTTLDAASGRRAKPVKRNEIVERGRKDPGMKNPRGGLYSSRDVREQLAARPGTLPQEGPRTAAENAIIERIMKAEDRRNYNRDDVMRRIADDDAKKKRGVERKSKSDAKKKAQAERDAQRRRMADYDDEED